MGNAWAALFGALIGACAAICSGLAVEAYKRHRDRQGTALALAGEIFAILHLTRKRGHVQWFASILPQLDAGQDIKTPSIINGPPKLDPVIEKHIDKLGGLGGNLPFRITTFHSYLQGIRMDVVDLAEGKHDGDPATKAHLIREDLALWAETEKLGDDLVRDLQHIATTPLPFPARVRAAWAILTKGVPAPRG